MSKQRCQSAVGSSTPKKDRVEEELKYAASLCFWCEKRLEQVRNMKESSDPKTEDPEVTKYINDSVIIYEGDLASLRMREASLKAKIEVYMKQF